MSTLVEELVQEDTKTDEGKKIILFNDDHNTFDHVIECLVTYCDHERVQAEQCASIVHHNGKTDVKSGDFDTLLPICNALTDHGLSAEIQ